MSSLLSGYRRAPHQIATQIKQAPTTNKATRVTPETLHYHIKQHQPIELFSPCTTQEDRCPNFFITAYSIVNIERHILT